MLSGMVGKSSPPSAAKLPATAHGRRTRAAIIDAAAQMMYQKGVAATSRLRPAEWCTSRDLINGTGVS